MFCFIVLKKSQCPSWGSIEENWIFFVHVIFVFLIRFTQCKNLHGIMRYMVAGFFTHGRKKYSNLISWESRTVKNVPFRVNGIWLLRLQAGSWKHVARELIFPSNWLCSSRNRGKRYDTIPYSILHDTTVEGICWSSNTFHVSLIRVQCNSKCYYR